MGELVVLQAAQQFRKRLLGNTQKSTHAQNEGMNNIFVPKRDGFVPKPVSHVSLTTGCFKFNLGALPLCRVDVSFPRQAALRDSAQQAVWPQTATDP